METHFYSALQNLPKQQEQFAKIFWTAHQKTLDCLSMKISNVLQKM